MNTQFNPHKYVVLVTQVAIDGEEYFRATVEELPDVEVFEETNAAAYEQAIGVIADLYQLALDDKRPFPEPQSQAEEAEGSVRFTLRIPYKVHRQLVKQAKFKQIPLNTEVLLKLTESTAMGELTDTILKAFNAVSEGNPAEQFNRGLRVAQMQDTYAAYQGSFGEQAFVKIHNLTGIVKDHPRRPGVTHVDRLKPKHMGITVGDITVDYGDASWSVAAESPDTVLDVPFYFTEPRRS